MSSPHTPSLFTDHGDPPSERPSPLNPLGILSLLGGLFSLLALLGQAWWICAGLGLLVCTLVMIHLNQRRETKAGMTLGTLGLAISLLAVSFAPTYFYLRQIKLCRQSALLGQEWLSSITGGETYKALAATENPEHRLVYEQLKNFYHGNSEDRKTYDRFIKKKLIHTLIALDGRARIRFFANEDFSDTGAADIITNLYAVTYLENPLTRKTFFVRIVIERKDDPDSRAGLWKILRYQGGVHPRV